MRVLFASAAIAAALISTSAPAASVRDYNASLFYGLQERNEPVVLLVTEGSCNACSEQEVNVKKLASTPGYDRIHVLRIDARKQPWALKGLKSGQRPMLIGFHGLRETARAANAPDLTQITAVFASTLR